MLIRPDFGGLPFVSQLPKGIWVPHVVEHLSAQVKISLQAQNCAKVMNNMKNQTLNQQTKIQHHVIEVDFLLSTMFTNK